MQHTPLIPTRDPELRKAAIAFLCTIIPAGIALGILTHGNSWWSASGEFVVTFVFFAVWHRCSLRRQRKRETARRDADGRN